MADENQLKDAKITLRLDVEEALGDVEKLDRRKTGGKSTPGDKPPSPGREDEQAEHEERERDRKRRPSHRNAGGGVAVVGATKRARSAVVGVVKTLAAATALQVVADAVPAMIAQRKESLGPLDVKERLTIEALEVAVGMPLTVVSQVLNTAQAMLPTIAAVIGTGTDALRAKAVAGVDIDVKAVALLQGKVAAAQAAMGSARRRIVAQGAAKEILEAADSSEILKPLQDALFGNTSTAK